jgi:hypothetical protein
LGGYDVVPLGNGIVSWHLKHLTKNLKYHSAVTDNDGFHWPHRGPDETLTKRKTSRRLMSRLSRSAETGDARAARAPDN